MLCSSPYSDTIHCLLVSLGRDEALIALKLVLLHIVHETLQCAYAPNVSTIVDNIVERLSEGFRGSNVLDKEARRIRVAFSLR